MIYIFTEDKGDGIKSRQPPKIFSTLNKLKFPLFQRFSCQYPLINCPGPRKWTSRYVILELGIITIYNSYFDNDSNDIITSFEVKDINHIIRDHLFFT